MSMLIAVACCMSVFAATPAEESAERIANLEKMLKSVPGATGVADLDAYVAESAAAGTLAVENSILLKAAAEGDLSVVVKLADNLKKEQEALEKSMRLAPKAAEGLKKLNPMKAGKAKKAIDFANKCNEVVTAESVYQAQVVASLSK